MMTPDLSIKRLTELAVVPRYQSTEAAGMDLHAAIESPVDLAPGEIVPIPLGFAMAIPEGYEAQVRPRSGLSSRHGVTLPNAPGPSGQSLERKTGRGHAEPPIPQKESSPARPGGSRVKNGAPAAVRMRLP